MKKKNLKKILVVSGITLMLGITACGKEGQEKESEISTAIEENSEINTTKEIEITSVENTSQEEFQKIAEKYLQLLAEGSFEKLSSDFEYDTKVKELIEDGTLIASFQQTMEALGELKTTQTPIIEEQNPYIIVSIPCNFEAQDVNMNFVFTEDGKITEIQMSDFTENTEETVPEGVIEEELALDIGDGKTLPGTFTRPAQEGKYPVVILVHGSGPNDRNESIGPNKPFQDIAWELAEQGIASYRYDKRTKVYPQDFIGNPEAGIYEETIADAVSAVEMAGKLENVDGQRVFLLGHSLGGGFIPKINEKIIEENQKEDIVAGYIFLAAPTRKYSTMMKEQYDLLFSLVENPTEEQKAQMEAIRNEIEKLNNLDSADSNTQILNAYPSYWKELEEYDMLAEAEKITVPCLVLQGEEDYQVTMEDFNSLKEKFGEKENWIFHSYPGLTHLFMKGEKKNAGAEYNTKQNIDAMVIQDIIKFITE